MFTLEMVIYNGTARKSGKHLLVIINKTFIIINNRRTGEITQWLRALTAFVGPESGSQHPHGGPQPSIIPVPGD